jgi:asparagine synthase (glutamine-hydrolysing)
MYNLWHEDRTAAAHSIESRVPFLDHRIVECLVNVPPRLHRELFWDKAILRKGMARQLPEEFVVREKVPFFAGEDERYTRRLLYTMLRSEKDRLIDEALAGSEMAGRIIDADFLRALVEDIPNDPEFSNVEPVLQLVNLGLLTLMARNPPANHEPHDSVNVSEVRITDWAQWEKGNATNLLSRTEGLDRQSALRFAEGVLLAACVGGDPACVDAGGHYLLINGELRFVLEAGLEEWIRFLCLVDGRRSVQELLTQAQTEDVQIWKHLEEAIEHRILEVGKTT